MVRTILTVLLPLLLPFLVYFLYVSIARARGVGSGDGNQGGQPQPTMSEAPWPWLAAVGLVLAATVLLSWRFLSDPAEPGTRIIQDRYIDGEIVPSHRVEDDDETPAGD